MVRRDIKRRTASAYRDCEGAAQRVRQKALTLFSDDLSMAVMTSSKRQAWVFLALKEHDFRNKFLNQIGDTLVWVEARWKVV